MALKDSGGSALGSSRGTAAARSAANAGGFNASGGNYMRGTSNTIPSETPSGQLGMFSAGAYKTPMPRGGNMRGTAFGLKPPFKPTGTGRPAPGDGARLARNAELIAKRSASRTYNRDLSPEAADMVGGNYGRMNASEYNFKPKPTYGPMTATQYVDFLFKG
jgi:hypothetical protein